jgi:ABC-type branched-subunit amino acid transport system ATPase component
MERGEITISGDNAELISNKELVEAYLGDSA